MADRSNVLSRAKYPPTMAGQPKRRYFALVGRRPGRWPVGVGLTCAVVASLAMWWGIARVVSVVISLVARS